MRRSRVWLPAVAVLVMMMASTAATHGDRHQETPRGADGHDARKQEHGT
jgi:hypothetical protein